MLLNEPAENYHLNLQLLSALQRVLAHRLNEYSAFI